MTERLATFSINRRWLAYAIAALLSIGVWTAVQSHAATSTVTIQNFAFNPPDLTVHVGDTVTWTNQDSEVHAPQGGPINSPDLPQGASYSFTFNQLGDVNYICRIHTYMSGVVHVVDAGATTTTAAPTTTAPPSTTATTAPSTTATTAPGGTTTTTTPGDTTTTTAPPPPPPSGGPGFQDVPDDPSATYPPGTPGATMPPPTAAPSTTTTTAPPSSGPPPSYQDVPNDPSGGQKPGQATTVAQHTGGSNPNDLGDGTQLAPYTNEGGIKVFHLDMAPTTIEVAPGVTKDAYAFNGIVPGPVLRVNEGDRVRIVVTNHLPFATGVHWHGMILPNDQDGVPGITQPFIEPGETYTYEWTAVATGTHWYHSHTSGRHIGKGLYGALEVVPKTGDFAADRDYRMMLGDTDLGFVINGRQFPSTTPLVAKVGETVHLRVIDTGDQVHAIHLHGVPYDVVAQDGNKLAVPLKMDTLTISPGQTFDLLFKPVNPGKWLLHCHIFAHSHMSSDEPMAGDSGMTGMVTIVDVAPSDGALPSTPFGALPIAARGGHSTVSLAGSEPVLVVLAIGAVLLGVRGRRRSPHLTFPNRKDIPR